jgi:hypothetical protein
MSYDIICTSLKNSPHKEDPLLYIVSALDFTILTAGDDYEILNFNGNQTLTITLLDIIQGPAPWRADISIELS